MSGSITSLNKPTLVFGLTALLGACSESGGQQEEGSANEPATAEPVVSQGAVTQAMNTEQQIAYSIEELSNRLTIDPAAISLSSVKTVTWRSGARGCPQPGMIYTQALVPGVSILLLVGDTIYHYHAVTDGQPFFCPDDRVEPPAKGSGAD